MTNTIELYVWDDATQQWIAPLASGQELQALAQIVNNNTTIVTEFSEQVTEISGVVNDLEEDFNSHLEQTKYIDNRNDNSPPSFYYAKGSGKYREFKLVTTVGINTTGPYIAIDTVVPYSDKSGGKITQIGYAENGNILTRKSINETTWGAWSSGYADFATFTKTVAQTIPNSAEQRVTFTNQSGLTDKLKINTNGYVEALVAGVFELNFSAAFSATTGAKTVIVDKKSNSTTYLSATASSRVRCDTGHVFYIAVNQVTGNAIDVLASDVTSVQITYVGE